MRRPPRLHRLAGLLAAAALLVGGAGPALAEAPRPTVDPSAPTPAAPYPGLPPQGTAPDGSTVGGVGLDTRGLVTVPGAPPLPVGIDARGWLVADLGTGQVLGAQDPHGRYYPASTLKTLTLLTLAGRLDPALVVEGTVEDEAIEGSRVGLVHGGRYPVDLLFRALMMQSGNDCANALARAAGGVPATLAAMNATAERIGAYDTVAGTPSGLDVAGQSSSPYDLALIMAQLVGDPYSLGVLQTRVAEIPGVDGLAAPYQIQNQDLLLDSYPGTLAGKTGFTDAARHTFVAAVDRNGRRLVVALMQAERRPVGELDQATRLLDWGFATAPDARGVGRLVAPGEVPATAGPAPTISPPGAGDGEVSAEDAAAAPTAARTPVAAPPDETSAVLPVALGGGALLVVIATVVGRRRALRPVSPPPGSGAAAAAAPPSPPPGPRPPAAPGPAAAAPDR